MRRAHAALCFCLTALGSARARADEGSTPPASAAPAAPASPVFAPPRIESPPEVPYPEGGSGDAAVVLVLVIEADGSVRSAEVETGDEPFASAARAAALGWRFTPATRDGAPIVAKIRYQVGFTEVIEETPAEGPAGAAGAAGGGGTGAQPSPEPVYTVDEDGVIEVDVRGLLLPPNVSSLRRAEVRELPGAFGDPFRAIEILPGVTPIVSGLPFFYVRGAPPGNVGYFLDGVRVPYLFHAAAGPSVVHPALVDRVDLYSGAYPARHGRFAGAIVSAEATEPRTDWHGEGAVRLVDVGALVEGGFDGGRGTALVGGRYSYTAGLFSLLSPEISLDYRDYQTRVTYELDDRNQIGLFAFGAYDYLSETTNDIETVLFGAEFYRVDARYDHRLPGGGKMRLASTFGFDQTRVADGRNTRDVLVAQRLELSQPIGDDATLRAGMDVQQDLYSADQRRFADPDDPDTEEFNALFPPRADGALGAWADVVWKLDPRIEVTPGLRLDTFASGGAWAVSVDPRLSVVVDVLPGLRLLHAVGMAHQPPSFVVPVPGLAVANLQGGLQRSLQASAGVEVELPWSTTATLTAFDSVFMNMTDSLGVDPGDNDRLTLSRSLGYGRGFEVYLRRPLTKRIGGFISYTLSRSQRSAGRFSFPSGFDRTHVLNSALGYDLGRNWRVGTRFSLYSGPPRIDPPGAGSLGIRLPVPTRDPAFYRLDFRLEKKWRFDDTTFLAFVVEMLNATLNTETIRGQEVGPVSIPSIGLEGGF